MPFAQESVAPPGWNEPAGLAAPLAPVAPAAPAAQAGAVSLAETEAAVRWRLRAARIDNFIVYGGSVVLCLLLHLSIVSSSSLIVLGLVSIGYHFALESRGGQTIGKRRYGIRVVALDGGPAGSRAIAIRSVLRLVDQLPISYLSGLISMVRTGPARRQRIGDVAAGTVVVATDGRAAERGTPRWFLPAATIASAVASLLCVLAIANARSHPQQTQALSNCLAGASACVR
jgi:uncharacterized RDD family membrane protein YckC